VPPVRDSLRSATLTEAHWPGAPSVIYRDRGADHRKDRTDTRYQRSSNTSTEVDMRTLPVSLACLALGTAALADEPMRCGNWVVAMPVSLEELLRKCGEPASKEMSTEDIRTGGKSGTGSRAIGTSTTERWTYRSSAQSLPMIVTIVDGKVTKIEQGK
jgi:hypothetical protein